MSNNLHDLLKKDTRNLKKKNYPKSSDSSRVVRSTGIEAEAKDKEEAAAIVREAKATD